MHRDLLPTRPAATNECLLWADWRGEKVQRKSYRSKQLIAALKMLREGLRIDYGIGGTAGR